MLGCASRFYVIPTLIAIIISIILINLKIPFLVSFLHVCATQRDCLLWLVQTPLHGNHEAERSLSANSSILYLRMVTMHTSPD